MRKNLRLPRVLVAVCVVSSGCRAVHNNTESDVKFIGGEAATAVDYPSTVYFQHCSAAKVGPKQFLTAAHCLFQNDLQRPSFAMAPGTVAQVLVGISLEQGKIVPLTIASAVSYPGFDYPTLSRDYTKVDPNAAPVSGETPPTTIDVALITVEEETPELPLATFDEAPIALGQPLAVGGYGCESEGEQTNPLVRLKYAQVPPALIKGAFVSWRANSATEGYRSTCKGDSGGAVYRLVGAEKKIVGVNSGSPQGYSVFTTLAGPEGAKALAWVRQQIAEPAPVEPMTFKVMKCEEMPATAVSADGIHRSYRFDELKLAVKSGGKIFASIDRFKVSVKPDAESGLEPYGITVAEAAGCEVGVLCYKAIYTEATSNTKKLIAVQMKQGKMSVYEGEPVAGVTPLGAPLDPKACALSDVTP